MKITLLIIAFTISTHAVFGQSWLRKLPYYAEVGVGWRTGESAPGQPWGRPPGGYDDTNDGRLRYWMGGLCAQVGVATSFFNNMHTGLGIRPSFHYIRNSFFVMPNFVLYHDWYYGQKSKPNVWTFGIHLVSNKSRLPSSGRVPSWAQRAGLNIILDDVSLRTYGFGVRGGHVLAHNGWLKNTFLRTELTAIVPQRYGYPGGFLFQGGINIIKNIKL